MAAPITHIVIANKIFNDYFSNFDRKNFFIGTSFPDIQYLGVIDRATTHFKNEKISLENLNQDNDFTAGAKFHVIVDAVRENYIIANKTYELLPESKNITQSLKILEDELLYEKVSDWKKIIKDFESIPFEQIKFGLDKEHIENWYSLLREYFSAKPNPEIKKKFITRIGFGEEDANEMNNFVDSTRNNERIQQIIYGLFDQFELLLKEFAAKDISISD